MWNSWLVKVGIKKQRNENKNKNKQTQLSLVGLRSVGPTAYDYSLHCYFYRFRRVYVFLWMGRGLESNIDGVIVIDAWLVEWSILFMYISNKTTTWHGHPWLSMPTSGVIKQVSIPPSSGLIKQVCWRADAVCSAKGPQPGMPPISDLVSSLTSDWLS